MTRHGNSRHEPKQDIQVSRLSQDRDMKNQPQDSLQTKRVSRPHHWWRSTCNHCAKLQPTTSRCTGKQISERSLVECTRKLSSQILEYARPINSIDKMKAIMDTQFQDFSKGDWYNAGSLPSGYKSTTTSTPPLFSRLFSRSAGSALVSFSIFFQKGLNGTFLPAGTEN